MSKSVKTIILGIIISIFFSNNVLSYSEIESKGKILLVVSSKLQNTEKKKSDGSIDFFQLVSVYHFLKKAHFEPFIASPNGGTIAVDFKNINKKDFKEKLVYEKEKDFFDKNLRNKKTTKLETTVDNLNEYKGVIILGGKDSIYDLPYNKTLGKIITIFHKNKKPIGAISEGVLGLISSTRNPEGYLVSVDRKNTVFATNYVSDWIFRGYNITCISDSDYGKQKSKTTPYQYLKYAGVYLSFSKNSPLVLNDRELITVQNNKALNSFNYMFLDKIK